MMFGPSPLEITIVCALILFLAFGRRLTAWLHNQSVGEARSEDERER